MPFDNTNTFYTDEEEWDSDSIYDYRDSNNTKADMKDIMYRYNDEEQRNNRICNLNLLLYGDYECDGKDGKFAPCSIECYPGFCWHHVCEVIA